MAPNLYLVFSKRPEAISAGDYDAWYEKHAQENIESPGFTSARRYEISQVDGGCQVTETTWDRRPGWFRMLAGKATGVSDRGTENAKNIAATLARLKAHAEKS